MENYLTQIPSLSITRDNDLVLVEGSIILDAWQGFQSSNGFYNALKGEKSGFFALEVGGDMVWDDNPVIMLDHLNAFNYILQNQRQIKDNILATLFAEYQKLRISYDYDEATAKEIMPDINDKKQFINLITPSSIHILNVSRDGVAYVGYEFGCTWDDEHGLGIMTHKDRIIKIDGADSSFLTWVAQKDLDKPDAEIKVLGKKRWWQSIIPRR